MVECEFEADVLTAVLQSRWPERTDGSLRAHAATCPICSDVVAVAGAIHCEAEQTLPAGNIPDAGRVWWVAQMRARREAAKTAGRPITAVQVLAFSAAMGLLGACFGATSEWFQTVVRLAGSIDVHWQTVGLFGGVAALVILIPFALVMAIGRD
ncbi:MAG: hypothetical protein JWN34_3780 [Bryobacterales bacterium]|nr:hypothetical protein [Bryobacterales bacterium]